MLSYICIYVYKYRYEYTDDVYVYYVFNKIILLYKVKLSVN